MPDEAARDAGARDGRRRRRQSAARGPRGGSDHEPVQRRSSSARAATSSSACCCRRSIRCGCAGRFRRTSHWSALRARRMTTTAFASTAASSSSSSCRTTRSRRARSGTTSPGGSAISPADFNDTRHFVALKERLAQNDEQFGTAGNHLFYLATPPPVFPEIIKHLKRAGLEKSDDGWTRVVVEKPFGTDLESARALQSAIEAVFPENEIYRIDHYLGQRAGTGHHRAALRQHDLRADLEPELRAERSDHVGGVARRRAARRRTTITPARCAT